MASAGVLCLFCHESVAVEVAGEVLSEGEVVVHQHCMVSEVVRRDGVCILCPHCTVLCFWAVTKRDNWYHQWILNERC